MLHELSFKQKMSLESTMGLFNIQELREMAKLPGTRPEMLAADFDGVTEALKSKQWSLICFWLYFPPKKITLANTLFKNAPFNPHTNFWLWENGMHNTSNVSTKGFTWLHFCIHNELYLKCKFMWPLNEAVAVQDVVRKEETFCCYQKCHVAHNCWNEQKLFKSTCTRW